MKILIYITAPYCGACKLIKRDQLDGIAEKIGRDNILEVDGTQNFGIAKQYGVTKVPTTLVVDGDKILYRGEGRIDEKKVLSLFRRRRKKTDDPDTADTGKADC